MLYDDNLTDSDKQTETNFENKWKRSFESYRFRNVFLFIY